MPGGIRVPRTDSGCICIVNRVNVLLAAAVSSRFARPGTYFPIFGFPDIEHRSRPEARLGDDDYIANVSGSSEATFIANSVARLRDVHRVILAGLSPAQMSYLHLPNEAEVVNIEELDDVRFRLGGERVLQCRKEDVLLGLFRSGRDGFALEIVNDAEPLTAVDVDRPGLVLIETLHDTVATVAGVNYAVAADAALTLVAPPDDGELVETRNILEQRKADRSAEILSDVLPRVAERIAGISISSSSYATYFTEGLPYSAVVGDTVQQSYVNLRLRAEHFLVNNLAPEVPLLPSALMFSLDSRFHVLGEGHWLAEFLRLRHYIVREVVGPAATITALDYQVQHFPYGILHIASHAGLSDGYAVSLRFTDRDGHSHVVEYDEAASISREPGTELFQVVRKAVFRKFDGLVWRSSELRARGLPSYVFDDMNVALWEEEYAGREVVSRAPISSVPLTDSIECADGFHQSMFQTLASHSSPIVFNNACGSWWNVADFFLSCGARGYVGTLWAIDESAAVAGAKALYRRAVNAPLIAAVQKANKRIAHTADRAVYAFWGLHSGNIPPAQDEAEGLNEVLNAATGEMFRYTSAIANAKSPEVRENAIRAVERIHNDIRDNYRVRNMAELDAEFQARFDAAIAQSQWLGS
jgi:hypothetical protein